MAVRAYVSERMRGAIPNRCLREQNERIVKGNFSTGFKIKKSLERGAFTLLPCHPDCLLHAAVAWIQAREL